MNTRSYILYLFLFLFIKNSYSQKNSVILYKLNGDSIVAKMCLLCTVDREIVTVKINNKQVEFKADSLLKIKIVSIDEIHYSIKTESMSHYQFALVQEVYDEFEIYGRRVYSADGRRVFMTFEFIRTPFNSRANVIVFEKRELLKLSYLKCYNIMEELLSKFEGSIAEDDNLLKVMDKYEERCAEKDLKAPR